MAPSGLTPVLPNSYGGPALAVRGMDVKGGGRAVDFSFSFPFALADAEDAEATSLGLALLGDGPELILVLLMFELPFLLLSVLAYSRYT